MGRVYFTRPQGKRSRHLVKDSSLPRRFREKGLVKYHIVATIRCTCHAVNHHTLHLPHGAPTTQCAHHMVHLQHSGLTTWWHTAPTTQWTEPGPSPITQWTTTHCTYHTVHLPHSALTTQCTDLGPSPATCCTYHTVHMQLDILNSASRTLAEFNMSSWIYLLRSHGLFRSVIRAIWTLGFVGVKKIGVKCWFTGITGGD